MPYSGSSDPKLPENVKKMSPKRRRQWVHVFNSAIARNPKDESRAFASANAVAGRKENEVDDVIETISLSELTDDEWADLDSGQKAMVDIALPGSMEHVSAQAHKKLNPSFDELGHSDTVRHRVIATYPEHLMVQSYDYADMASGDSVHKVPYTVDESGDITIHHDKAQKHDVTLQPRRGHDTKPFRHLDVTSGSKAGGNDVVESVSLLRENPVMWLARKLHILGPRDDASAHTKSAGGAFADLGAVAFKEGDSVPLGSWVGEGPLLLTKDASGRERFLVWYTNCYADRTDEIMATAGHKAYADWANANKEFPEMWLWHKAGTRWGEADHLIHDGGVTLATGLVDQGREATAEGLCAMGKDLGFSHGYLGQRSKEGKRQVWTSWKDVEITALPVSRAANPYGPEGLKELLGSAAPINFLKEMAEGGTNVPFTDEQKAFMVGPGKLTESAVKVAEGIHENFVQKLKSVGLEWKGLDDETVAAKAAGPGEGNADLKPVLTDLYGLKQAAAGLVDLAQKAVATAEEAKTIAQKSATDFEAAVKSAMTPRAADSGAGHDPKAATATGQADEAATKEAGADADWFLDGIDRTLGMIGVQPGFKADAAASAAEMADKIHGKLEPAAAGTAS